MELTVAGRVDQRKTATVSEMIEHLVDGDGIELVVDLTDSWDGAVLLPGLTRARVELAARGARLRLVGVAVPEFLPALRRAPLDQVFLVYDAVRRPAPVDEESVSPRCRHAG